MCVRICLIVVGVVANIPTVYLWYVVYNLEPCDGLCYSLQPLCVELQNLWLLHYELWLLNGSLKKIYTEADKKYTVRTAVLQHYLPVLICKLVCVKQFSLCQQTSKYATVFRGMRKKQHDSSAWCIWLCCGPHRSTVEKSIMLQHWCGKFTWMIYDFIFFCCDSGSLFESIVDVTEMLKTDTKQIISTGFTNVQLQTFAIT